MRYIEQYDVADTKAAYRHARASVSRHFSDVCGPTELASRTRAESYGPISAVAQLKSGGRPSACSRPHTLPVESAWGREQAPGSWLGGRAAAEIYTRRGRRRGCY